MTSYTHFIGVLAPESFVVTVEDSRSWMNERYGCKSGYRTAPHITLVSPFAVSDPDSLAALESAFVGWAEGVQPFEASVTGFGAFAERTIFVHVDDNPFWAIWHQSLLCSLRAACPGVLPSRREIFTPHLTVANRDIPVGSVAPALRHFAGLDLHETFLVDHAALFAWNDGQWIVQAVVEAGV